jgi:hypothetical protein
MSMSLDQSEMTEAELRQLWPLAFNDSRLPLKLSMAHRDDIGRREEGAGPADARLKGTKSI